MWLPLHTCATHPPAPRDGRRLRAQQAARAVAGTPQRSLRHCLVQRELLGKGATWCTMRAPKRGDRALEGPAEHCVGAAGHPRGPWAACALPACFSSTCCQPRPATTPPSPAAPLACPAERRPHADCQRRPDRLPVGHRARRPDWWAQGSRAESRRQPSLPLFGGPHVLSALQRLPSRSCSHSQIRPAPPGPPPPPHPPPPPTHPPTTSHLPRPLWQRQGGVPRARRVGGVCLGRPRRRPHGVGCARASQDRRPGWQALCVSRHHRAREAALFHRRLDVHVMLGGGGPGRCPPSCWQGDGGALGAACLVAGGDGGALCAACLQQRACSGCAADAHPSWCRPPRPLPQDAHAPSATQKRRRTPLLGRTRPSVSSVAFLQGSGTQLASGGGWTQAWGWGWGGGVGRGYTGWERGLQVLMCTGDGRAGRSPHASRACRPAAPCPSSPSPGAPVPRGRRGQVLGSAGRNACPWISNSNAKTCLLNLCYDRRGRRGQVLGPAGL